MTNPVATDITDYLAGVGALSLTKGTNLFKEKEPTSPSNVVTVYTTGGFEPNPKWAIDYPTFQVRVRNVDVDAAYVLMDKIKNIFLSWPKTVINNSSFDGIWVVGDITPLGRDENDNFILVLNFRCMTEPQDIGNRTKI